MSPKFTEGEKILGRFEVQEVIPGGMGEVVCLYDYETKRQFAAKTFRDDIFSLSPSVRQRFINEARAMIRMVPHQNIVYSETVEVLQGKPYLFMEWVNGGDLARLVPKLSAEKNAKQVVSLALQFCKGMMHANSSGIKVHRDIKPKNCLIADRDRLRITDFGLATVLDGTSVPRSEITPRNIQRLYPYATHAGMIFGTLPYMAPELFDDYKHADILADVYSFGIMLYEMIKGSPPFWGNRYELEVLHKTKNPPLLPKTSPDLRDLIYKCLEKDPKQRFSGFSELAGELTSLYEPTRGTNTHASTKPDIQQALNLFQQGKLKEACQYLDPSQSDIQKAAILFAQGKTDEAAQLIGRSHSHTFPMPIIDMQEAHQKARSLCNLGRYEEAIKYFDKALEILPKAEVWSGKGSALRELGRLKEALDCFEQAVLLEPGVYQFWINKGNTLSDLDRPQEAEESFKRALDLLLTDKPGRKEEVFKSSLKKAKDSPFGYRQLLQEALVDLNPQDLTTWYNKGNALFRIGKYQAAIECYDKATGINSRFANAWTNKGVTLGRLGRFEEALDCYDHSLSVDPRSGATWHNKGLAMTHLGRLKEALDCFTQAVKLGYAHAEEGIRKCRAAMARPQNQEPDLTPEDIKAGAFRIVPLSYFDGREEDLLIAFHPKDDRGWFLKGRKSWKEGHWEEALSHFEQALELNPDNQHAWYMKGACLEKLGKHRETIHCYDQALRIDPNFPEPLHFKGVCLYEQKKHEAALACFDRVVRLRPDSSKEWTWKGMALSCLGRLREALECYDRAIQLNPKFAAVWFKKGDAMAQLKRLDEAISCYDRALNIEPNDARALTEKGVFLGMSGKLDDALSCLKQALVVDEQYPAAWHNIGVALQNQARYGEALVHFEKAYALGHQPALQGIKHCRSMMNKK